MFFVSEENTPLSFFMTDDGFLVFFYTIVSRMKDRAKSGAREEVKTRQKTKKDGSRCWCLYKERRSCMKEIHEAYDDSYDDEYEIIYTPSIVFAEAKCFHGGDDRWRGWLHILQDGKYLSWSYLPSLLVEGKKGHRRRLSLFTCSFTEFRGAYVFRV